MDELDMLSHRAIDAMKHEARAITDTEQALRDLHDRPTTSVVTEMKPRRGPQRWWVAAAAAAVVAAVVVGAIIIARANDKPQRIVSTPPTNTEPAPQPEPAPATTVVSSTIVATAPEATVVETTEAPTTTVSADTVGFVRPCVESIGQTRPAEPLDPEQISSFGPLQPDPVLTVNVPSGVTMDDRQPLPPVVRTRAVPGGIVMAVSSNYSAYFPDSMLISVNNDGSKRWTRCFDQPVNFYVAPATDGPTKGLIVTEDPDAPGPLTNEQFVISLDDGSTVGRLLSAEGTPMVIDRYAAAESANTLVFTTGRNNQTGPADQLTFVDLRDMSATQISFPSVEGVDRSLAEFEFTDDGDPLMRANHTSPVAAVLRNGQWTEDTSARRDSVVRIEFVFPESTLVATDGLGQALWQRADIFDPSWEGFRVAPSNDVIVVSGCSDNGCTKGRDLYGLDPATGGTVWHLPLMGVVSVVADGYAIVADTTPDPADTSWQPGPWVLIDTATGEQAGSDQTWSDRATFAQGCCDDTASVTADGGIVVGLNENTLRVWVPRNVGLEPQTISVP